MLRTYSANLRQNPKNNLLCGKTDDLSKQAAEGLCAPTADAAFHARFSHRPEDGAGIAALQLTTPRLLWQLAQPRAIHSMTNDQISSRQALATAADGLAPALPAKLRPGGSMDRGMEGSDMHLRAASAHTGKGFTRLVWDGGDLAAQMTLMPLRVQARGTSSV